MRTEGEVRWSEEDSLRFIEQGRIQTPSRDGIQEAILSLMPVQATESFVAVELGVGSGWLSEAILDRFPGARVLGLDASPTMLEETRSRLQRFAGRLELRRFRLEDRSWLEQLQPNVRCFVSSLVIHHLDAAGKLCLYRDLFDHIGQPGGVLIADLVAPRSEWERQYVATQWDAEVERQSLAFSGSSDIYRQFVHDQMNIFRYLDPMDMPSSLPDHLAWLEQAGFQDCNVFWERAGHAVYGGYRLSDST